jgi:TolB protein
LIAHLLPVVSLLALYGIYRRRTFLLASFVPFGIYPLFSKRTEIRFILPYMPVLILYAMIGVNSVRKERYRLVLYVFLALSTIVGLFVNREQLEKPVSDGYEWAKRLGAEFKDRIGPEDKVGDRKPFFAFYAGGRYAEIPIATYEEVIQHLAAGDVRYLVLHRMTIHHMRPALRPLLYDRAFINGELRFHQIYYYPDNVLIYERSGTPDPLKYHKLEVSGEGRPSAPRWSPDGKSIAFRSIGVAGNGRIRIAPADGGKDRPIVAVDSRLDPLSWSPDSKHIAYATEVGGNLDIYTCDVATGETTRVTTHIGVDTSPSWAKDGKEIAFCSNRSGEEQVWVKDLATGGLTQVTHNGAHVQPALSHDGSQVACISPEKGVVVHNRRTNWERVVTGPGQPTFAPAWSPEDHFIAVTGEGWGGTDVYLINPDGGGSLVLTEIGFGDGLPSWSPDGRRIAISSNRDGTTGLWIVTGLGAHKKRLQNPRPIRTVKALQ